MTNPIIFLDIDGVLCTERSHTAQGRRPEIWHMEALDREGVGMLNNLVRLFSCQFVLSSTWRKAYDREWMESHLRRYGWGGEFHNDWRTPEINGEIIIPCKIAGQEGSDVRRAVRGDEIADWLSRHQDVKEYVIFDDDSDMLPEQKGHFVHTHTYDGIRWSDYERAEKILARHIAKKEDKSHGDNEGRS